MDPSLENHPKYRKHGMILQVINWFQQLQGSICTSSRAHPTPESEAPQKEVIP